MKQLLAMIVLTLVGTVGVLTHGPFVAIAVYYLFAVLRPQYLWEWVLPPDIRWSYYVALAAILGTFGAALGFLTPPPEAGWGDDAPKLRLTIAHKLLMGFGVWVCLSYITAQYPDLAYPWFQEYLKIFVIFVLASIAVRTLQQVWILYLVATAALMYIAYEVNSLYIFQGRLDIYKRGYGGLDNNGAGLMLAMGVPLAIFAWEGSRHWFRWIFAAALPVLLHAVLMTYSRGAMLSLIVSTPLLLLRTRRRLQFGVLFLALLMVIPILAGPEIRARFFTLNEVEQDESANSRFGSWTAAVRIANDYPVLGVGIRNSNQFSYQYGADMPGRTIHSQYLQILADSGYPALALYVASIVMMLLLGVRARWRLRGRTDEEARAAVTILNGIEGSMVVFAFGGAFLSLEVFELPYLVLFIGAQTCAILSAQHAAAPAEARAPRPAPVGPTPYAAPGRLAGRAARGQRAASK